LLLPVSSARPLIAINEVLKAARQSLRQAYNIVHLMSRSTRYEHGSEEFAEEHMTKYNSCIKYLQDDAKDLLFDALDLANKATAITFGINENALRKEIDEFMRRLHNQVQMPFFLFFCSMTKHHNELRYSHSEPQVPK
ncbi:hypothetical protein PMAYCL1PPCAC_09571, partial [Pristionchus mayeri]